MSYSNGGISLNSDKLNIDHSDLDVIHYSRAFRGSRF